MKKYFRLLRLKNYIKNFLIFLPFVFSGAFTTINSNYINLLVGFVAFCFASSFIYILNDYMDMDKDKLHPVKCNRPLASGEISVKKAICIAIILSVCILLSLFYLRILPAAILLLLYIFLNLLYSLKLKNVPIVDVAILSLFFIIRIYYGAFLVGVPVSVYLYLTVMSVSFMMGVNKRKNEKRLSEDCRSTLNYYSYDFLNKMSQTFMSLSAIFYSLWIISDTNILFNKTIMQISIFLVVFILMLYQYIVDKDDNGNPVDVLLNNKMLLLSVLAYGVLIIVAFLLK